MLTDIVLQIISCPPTQLLIWINTIYVITLTLSWFQISYFTFRHLVLLLDALHCVPTVDSYQWGLPLSSDPSALFIDAEKTRRKM